MPEDKLDLGLDDLVEDFKKSQKQNEALFDEEMDKKTAEKRAEIKIKTKKPVDVATRLYEATKDKVWIGVPLYKDGLFKGEVHKEIGECTAEEFFLWAKKIFPLIATYQEYDSQEKINKILKMKKNRVEVFNAICKILASLKMRKGSGNINSNII